MSIVTEISVRFIHPRRFASDLNVKLLSQLLDEPGCVVVGCEFSNGFAGCVDTVGLASLSSRV